MTAIQKAREALDEARIFIAAEYADASAEVYGEWLASEARPVFSKICIALAALDAETPATPADVGEEPVSVQDPVMLLAGIKQFGLAGDGSDLRDLASSLERVVRERDEALERIENAMQSMSETQPSWERRCHSIMSALGLDFGGPTPDIPEQSGWYARKMEQLEAKLESAETKLAEARADPTTDQVEGALVAWHDVLSIKDKPRSEFWRMFAAIRAARRFLEETK